MYKRMMAAVLMLLVGIAATGCLVREVKVSENADQRNLTGFERVRFSGVGKLEVRQGSTYSVQVDGPADLVKRIETRVDGDTLVIRWTRGVTGIALLGSTGSTVRIAVVTPTLKGLDISGASEADVSGFSGDVLDITSSGASEINCNDVKLDRLSVNLSGAGDTSISGEAREADVRTSGAASYKAADLKTATTRLEQSGGGDAKVWATDALDVNVSGAASVDYYGDPVLTKNISGAADIERKGSK